MPSIPRTWSIHSDGCYSRPHHKPPECERVQVTKSMLSDCSGVKWGVGDFWKIPQIWKLTHFLITCGSKKKSEGKLRSVLNWIKMRTANPSENVWIWLSHSWGAASVALNAYIRREKRLQLNDFSVHLQNLEKGGTNESQSKKKKTVIKIRAKNQWNSKQKNNKRESMKPKLVLWDDQ